MNVKKFRFLPLFFLLVFATVGCSSHSVHYNAGLDAIERQSFDEAVLNFSKALEQNPSSVKYQARYLTASSKASWSHLEKARALRQEGKLIEAATEYRQAYEYNKTLTIALDELNEINQEQKTREILSEAAEFYRKRRLPQAKNLLSQVLDRDPTNQNALELLDQIRKERNILMGSFELEVSSKEPITLKFKDASLEEVFKILNKLSGVNFILDDDLKNQSVSLLLEDATFSQALELLLKMNNLSSRVLNPKTIIIYSNSKDKQKQYEDQIIQTFYLSNIDAKKAVNMLRTMLQLRKVYVHEELNAIVVRDNPEVVKLVEKMLENADLSDSEVVFDLELIEVSRSDILQIGPKLSTYSVSAGGFKGGNIVSSSLPTDGPPINLLSDFRGLNGLFTLPTASFDLSKTLADTDILATPKIR
jgi:general secretion pathway protein D